MILNTDKKKKKRCQPHFRSRALQLPEDVSSLRMGKWEGMGSDAGLGKRTQWKEGPC